MLKKLYRHPEKNFLGAEFFLYWGTGHRAVLQGSFEDLERFARNPDDPNMPTSQHFNRRVEKDGGLYETCIVERSNYEAIYSNIPVFGLAKATECVRASVAGRLRGAIWRAQND